MPKLSINIEPYTFSEAEKCILCSPFASYWLKDQVAKSTERDCLDALKDVQTLVEVLTERVNNALR